MSTAQAEQSPVRNKPKPINLAAKFLEDINLQSQPTQVQTP